MLVFTVIAPAAAHRGAIPPSHAARYVVPMTTLVAPAARTAVLASNAERVVPWVDPSPERARADGSRVLRLGSRSGTDET
jgi:hypothetical protein